jgi:hypothetical protein
MSDSTSSLRPSESRPSISRPQLVLVMAVFCLLAYAAWARGGTYVPWQAPLSYLAIGILVVLIVLPLIPGASVSFRLLLGRGLRDPVFYLGALFLGLLGIQWWNAGRELMFSYSRMNWEYSLPPHPGWPSAFNREEALEMLNWFFPAWVLLLGLRAGILKSRAGSLLMRWMVYNAGILAALGLVQYLSGTKSIYWLQPLDCVFFASFGYSNHAGAFFTLMLAVALGLFLQESSWHHGRARRRRLWALGGAALLCLIGANLSLSRAAILLSWGVAGLALLDILIHGWRLLSLAERARRVLFCVALLGLAVALVLSMGRETLWNEFHPPQEVAPGIPVVTRSQSLEITVPAAVRIWQQHPWVGVGGWGFRYLLSLNIPQDQWRLIVTGNANVHNDPLQFLTEFGLVGAGLMGGILLALLHPLIRAWKGSGPVYRFVCLGLSLMVLYSLMDIPFRSPAILYTWLALSAVLPDTAQRHPVSSHRLNEVIS